jgi:hypothetical protein
MIMICNLSSTGPLKKIQETCEELRIKLVSALTQTKQISVKLKNKKTWPANPGKPGTKKLWDPIA